MKSITSRQFIFITLFLMLSTKVLTIHPLVFEYAGKDAFWSILFGMFIDLLMLVLVVILLKRNKDTTFFKLLKKTFGCVIAKILLVILFVFITLKSIFLYQETYSFFLQILYTEIPPFMYVVPALFVTGYFAVKGIKTISRTMEVFAVFILIGMLVCASTALNGSGLENITPFFENGIEPSLNGLLYQMFYRGNAVILLCFMGKIDFSKHFDLKLYLFTIIMSLLIVGISLLFYMVYGPSVKYVEFTLADLPQYDPFVSDLGRFNWLSVVVCTVALFLTSSTFLYCLAQIGRWIFGFKRSIIPTSISLLIIIVIAFINQFSLVVMDEKVTNEWLWTTLGILGLYLIICIILLCVRRKKWTKH